MNAALTVTRVEVTRVYRNKRYLIFTLALPVMMYLLFGKQGSDMKNSGLTVNVYYMISMATLGAFSGALRTPSRAASSSPASSRLSRNEQAI